MKYILTTIGVLCIQLALIGSANAGHLRDFNTANSDDTFKRLFDVTDEKRWIIRGRVVNVDPDVSSTVTVIGGGATAATTTIPELDFTYFFTKHVAAELILGVTKHDMGAVDTALGSVDLGEVTLLPPTLTLQYHFRPDAKFRPYAGIGVNYTVLFDEEGTPAIANQIEYGNSFGLAFQAGFDYAIDDHWAVNFDIKKVYINTDVNFANNTINADVDLDPVLFGVGLAYRF